MVRRLMCSKLSLCVRSVTMATILDNWARHLYPHIEICLMHVTALLNKDADFCATDHDADLQNLQQFIQGNGATAPWEPDPLPDALPLGFKLELSEHVWSDLTELWDTAEGVAARQLEERNMKLTGKADEFIKEELLRYGMKREYVPIPKQLKPKPKPMPRSQATSSKAPGLPTARAVKAAPADQAVTATLAVPRLPEPRPAKVARALPQPAFSAARPVKVARVLPPPPPPPPPPAQAAAGRTRLQVIHSQQKRVHCVGTGSWRKKQWTERQKWKKLNQEDKLAWEKEELDQEEEPAWEAGELDQEEEPAWEEEELEWPEQKSSEEEELARGQPTGMSAGAWRKRKWKLRLILKLKAIEAKLRWR